MVNRSTLKDDLIAGFTGSILGLPQGVAFAILAGLPPEYGLYAAMIPPALSALFGSSFQMVAGPTNAVAILLFASLTHLAPAGSPDYIRLVLTVTLLTGVFDVLFGVAARKYFPRIPFMISATVAGSLFAWALDFYFGREVTGIKTVGALPAQLPPFSLPGLSLDTIRTVAPTALATTILATLAISISRSLGIRSGQRIDSNQEFIGQGISNIA